MMIHRSASSRRRRASKSAATSPHRSQTLRRPSTAVGMAGAVSPTGGPPVEGGRRRASLAGPVEGEGALLPVTVTAPDRDYTDREPDYTDSDHDHDHDHDNLAADSLMPDNFNRSPRSSLVPDSQRSPRNSLVPDGHFIGRSRNSLVPDSFNRSPRNSLVPSDAARSPRNSLVPGGEYSRRPSTGGGLGPQDADTFLRAGGGRNSLAPDPDYGGRGASASGGRNSLAPTDGAYSRSARNSLVADVSPSRQRASLVPDAAAGGGCSRAPRGSLVPDQPSSNRSPRGSIAGDIGAGRSPRGSIGPECGGGGGLSSRSPRGSIASEASFNRSPRNSLPLQDGRSPRGSIASAAGSLFDQAGARSPRGSVDMAFAPGTSRGGMGVLSNRSPSPYRVAARGAQGALNADAVAAAGSRRASSSVSQVSADDRKHLCGEHTKLNADGGMMGMGAGSLGLSAYGSVVYQLNHANMESSGMCDFVCRALGIVYRTVIVTVILVCLTTLPIVMFIIGIQFVRDCPKEPNIPVYMIVGGSFGTIKMVWVVWRQVRSRRYERLDARTRPPEDDDLSAGSRITNFLLTSFLLVWFVLGNLWIVGIYWPDFEPTLRDPNRWCHKTLYVFSLVHLAVVYSLLGVVALTTIAMVACQLCVCPLLISCK